MNNGIITGQPFGKFMDEFFNRSISDIVGTDLMHDSPSVNIIEKEDSYELEVAAPGLDKTDFNIFIEKDHLTISAKKEENKEESQNVDFKRREYNFYSFTRKFRLPDSVDRTSLEAEYKKGILKVVVLKTPEAKEKGPRTIEIK